MNVKYAISALETVVHFLGTTAEMTRAGRIQAPDNDSAVEAFKSSSRVIMRLGIMLYDYDRTVKRLVNRYCTKDGPTGGKVFSATTPEAQGALCLLEIENGSKVPDGFTEV